jgi:hypothetical protein
MGSYTEAEVLGLQRRVVRDAVREHYDGLVTIGIVADLDQDAVEEV